MAMNLLILGGMSPRHKEWVRQVADELRPGFDSIRFLDYRHWDTGAEMDIEYEVAQLANLAEDFGEYIVVAKSIGSAVATLANARGLIQPKFCLFMGFPLKVVEADVPEVTSSLSVLPRTVFVHNQQDPLGSADAVRNFVADHAPGKWKLLTQPGDTHEYLDFELMRSLSS